MRNAIIAILLCSAALLLTGCGMNFMKSAGFNAAGDGSIADGGDVGLSSTGGAIVAGDGANFAGTGGITVPTQDSIVARVQNALGVKATTGNFKTSIAVLRPNLLKVADPTKATGYDQVELLVYAACTDLTTGGTSSPMQTTYMVKPASTVSQNQTALVNAGMTMLDRHVASLASQGPAAPAVTAAYTKLLTGLEADSTVTSTMAFVSVCMAANSAGLMGMGF